MKDELASDHSGFRLMQRAGTIDRTMTELWDDGVPCDVKYHGYDAARVCPEYGVVLLMDDGTVTTVLNTEPLELTVEQDYLEEYLDRSIEE